MKNFLVLMHDGKLSLTQYEVGKYELRNYKGAKDIYIEEKEALDWKEFWEYMLRAVECKGWSEISIAAIYNQYSFSECLEIIHFPYAQGVKQCRVQEFSTALPELMGKTGLLQADRAVLVAWGDAAWSVDAYSAHPATLESGAAPYRLDHNDIIKAFTAPWPVQDAVLCEAVSVGNERTKLAQYVQSSKIPLRDNHAR